MRYKCEQKIKLSQNPKGLRIKNRALQIDV